MSNFSFDIKDMYPSLPKYDPLSEIKNRIITIFPKNLYSESGRKSCLSNVNCLWYRKVDDTFAITSNDLEETLQKLNDNDKDTEFTMEKASKRN